MQGYLIGLPLWIVVSNARVDPESQELTFDDVGAISIGRRAAIALFTEELFAERFSERANVAQSRIVRFDDPLQLANLLEDQLRRPIAHFAIDPQSLTATVQVGESQDLIRRLRQELNQ